MREESNEILERLENLIRSRYSIIANPQLSTKAADSQQNAAHVANHTQNELDIRKDAEFVNKINDILTSNITFEFFTQDFKLDFEADTSAIEQKINHPIEATLTTDPPAYDEIIELKMIEPINTRAVVPISFEPAAQIEASENTDGNILKLIPRINDQGTVDNLFNSETVTEIKAISPSQVDLVTLINDKSISKIEFDENNVTKNLLSDNSEPHTQQINEIEKLNHKAVLTEPIALKFEMNQLNEALKVENIKNTHDTNYYSGYQIKTKNYTIESSVASILIHLIFLSLLAEKKQETFLSKIVSGKAYNQNVSPREFRKVEVKRIKL